MDEQIKQQEQAAQLASQLLNKQHRKLNKKLQDLRVDLAIEQKLQEIPCLTQAPKAVLLSNELGEFITWSLSSQARNRYYLKFPQLSLDKKPSLSLQIAGPGAAKKEVVVELGELQERLITQKLEESLVALTQLAREMDTYKQLPISGNNYAQIRSFIQETKVELRALFHELETSYGIKWWENPFLLSLPPGPRGGFSE